MCNEFFRSLGYTGTAEWCELNPGQDPVEFWLKSVFPEKVFKKSRMLIAKKDRMPAICTWGFQHPTLENEVVNNARVDKLKTAMWSSAFKNRRCIIPLTSFVEWGERFKYMVSPVNAPLFGVAGLWNEKEQCTMLTHDPNEQIAPLHHRMPVIIHKRDFDLWLIEGGYDLLVPYSEQVKVDIIGERKEKPVKVKKVKPPPEHQQGSLF